MSDRQTEQGSMPKREGGPDLANAAFPLGDARERRFEAMEDRRMRLVRGSDPWKDGLSSHDRQNFDETLALAMTVASGCWDRAFSFLACLQRLSEQEVLDVEASEIPGAADALRALRAVTARDGEEAYRHIREAVWAIRAAGLTSADVSKIERALELLLEYPADSPETDAKNFKPLIAACRSVLAGGATGRRLLALPLFHASIMYDPWRICFPLLIHTFNDPNATAVFDGRLSALCQAEHDFAHAVVIALFDTIPMLQVREGRPSRIVMFTA